MDDPQLSPRAREFISNGANQIFLSAASAWEIAIKAGRGCVLLPEAPAQYVANRLNLHGFSALPIQVSHALHVFELPDIHRDPFDRLLVAQSQMEDLPLLTADEEMARYDVQILW
jgi:PIN domain nuclease of toxin-antitoxin system